MLQYLVCIEAPPVAGEGSSRMAEILSGSEWVQLLSDLSWPYTTTSSSVPEHCSRMMSMLC